MDARMHVADVIHNPTAGFMLFHGSTVGGGNVLRNVAMHQQSQERLGLLNTQNVFC